MTEFSSTHIFEAWSVNIFFFFGEGKASSSFQVGRRPVQSQTLDLESGKTKDKDEGCFGESQG